MIDRRDTANWAERHRPRRFDEVVGQSEAVAILRNQVVAGRPQHIALFGPSGTGKTTLARIYAAAINCLAADPLRRPCWDCEACRYCEEGYHDDYRQYNSRLDVNMETMRDIQESIRFTATGSWANRVFFFDEAHGLSGDAVTALLTLTERRGLPAVFLFATIDRDHLPVPLRGRCISIETRPLDRRTAVTLLEWLAAEEQLEAEPGALDLIAQVSHGGRDLVSGLERVHLAEGSLITVAGVRKALVNDRVARMVSYFMALAAGDLHAQLQTIAASALAPEDVLETIQRILTYLRLRYVGAEVARPSALYGYLDLIDEADCLQIVACLQGRAGAVGVPFPVLYDEMLEFWTFTPARWTPEAMNLQLVRFHDLVNAHRNAAVTTAPLPARREAAPEAMREGEVAGGGSTRRFRRPPGWRTAAAAAAGADASAAAAPSSDRLNAEQVRDLYEAATFLVQTRGVLFNAHLTLSWAGLGVGDDRRAIDLTSRLAHELGLRLLSWGVHEAGGFHRISLHEGADGDAGLCSHLVAHVPDRHTGRLERWVREKFLPRRLPGADAEGAVSIEVGSSAAKRANASRHWDLMRLLWRGLDPAITVETDSGERPALLDILGVRKGGRIGALHGRRYAISDAINGGARTAMATDRMAHLSVLADASVRGRAAWNKLDKGWELDEHEERRRELARRRDREEALRRAYWGQDDALFSSTYNLMMKQEVDARPRDPHDRKRDEKTHWRWWI